MTTTIISDKIKNLLISAQELRVLTSWPEIVIEDYLSLIDSLLTIADQTDLNLDKDVNKLIYSFISKQNFGNVIKELNKLIYSLINKPDYGNKIKELERLIFLHFFGSKQSIISNEYLSANNITLNVGTSADVASDLQTLLDGNIYTVIEVAAAPAINLEVQFTEISEFYAIVLRAYYYGSTTHWVEVQLYNNSTLAWDTYINLTLKNAMDYKYIEIPKSFSINYINASFQVNIRFYHPSSGNVSHDLYIDYLALLKSRRTL